MDRGEKLRACEELGGIPEEAYDDLLRLHAETTRPQVASLASAFERGDCDAVRELAHAIKGASANLRLDSLSRGAKAVEEAVDRKLPVDRIAAALAGLRRSLSDLEREAGAG
ncbi:MAG: Hpt domain-containing protein [bacterium]|nr:Hpt domain-containing protein [bacterium]